MRKRFFAAVTTGLVVLATGGIALAFTSTTSDVFLSGYQNNEVDILQFLEDLTGPVFDRDDFQYKAEEVSLNNPSTPEDESLTTEEEGVFGSYSTIFLDEVLDPKDAMIAYNDGVFITDPDSLVIKNGNMSPAWYLFGIEAWNGYETIFLNNFWTKQGAISHVSIYGSSAPVPEPGTMLLFGIGLGGLTIVGLRKKKRLS